MGSAPRYSNQSKRANSPGASAPAIRLAAANSSATATRRVFNMAPLVIMARRLRRRAAILDGELEHRAVAELLGFSRYSSSHGVWLAGTGGGAAPRRRAISASSTSASQRPRLRSTRIVSPVASQASPLPAALSGDAFRIEGLSDVPDWRPSPSVGRYLPAGCTLTSSGMS